jgi:hypothetical protein
VVEHLPSKYKALNSSPHAAIFYFICFSDEPSHFFVEGLINEKQAFLLNSFISLRTAIKPFKTIKTLAF